MKRSIYGNTPFVQRVYQKLVSQRLETAYYKKFFEQTFKRNDSNRKILIYAGIGKMFLTPVEILLYHLLKENGFEVEYYIYNEEIPINELITKKVIEQKGKEDFWKNNVSKAKEILTASKVKYSFITPDPAVYEVVNSLPNNDLDAILNFEYEGIGFGEIVEGVMYRYYKSLQFDEDAYDVAKKFLHTALINYFQIRNLHEKKAFNYVLFSHGIYCTWQPIVEYCRKEGINFICYDRAKTKGHCNFNLNRPSPVWDFRESWVRLKNHSLSEEEEQKVDAYLRQRILQKGDVFSYNFSGRAKDLSRVKEQLRIKEGSTVVTFFTNLIWDAANVSRDIAFKSPIECIVDTIKTLKIQNNIHFLVRIHPAEKVLGTEGRYGELVVNAFNRKIPENVTIINPDDNINSFDVLDISDIGVVHTSTVGLEMAIAEKPVILISDTHYRGKGFTYDAQNRKNYFEIIDKLISEPSPLPDQKHLSRKYFYLMMFEYQHQMPMSYTKSNLFNGYGYYSYDELKKDSDAPINKIIRRISGEEPFADFIFK
ncbi:hypothetical protein [Robiginitalea aurantiaca]|uniref:Capsule polysaccharide biosynthesis protein n=1 Tax=Robiginitalea aurantiaca TaxID=3056915 RepID=A0ABT7WE02_9FLAO|nr:hypothetical protein [Robiginitalea aurantiaca]MDM9631146.1 hypothetical protein [Robiginitalea aurantiaca]